MGKQKKHNFLTSGKKLRATKLELVHTDLWCLLHLLEVFVTISSSLMTPVERYEYIFLRTNLIYLIPLKLEKPGLKLKLV